MPTDTNAGPSIDVLPVRLTKRERDVLRLIAQGHSAKEAAGRLLISKQTVNFHLGNLYEKLGVNNRVQAIRAAARLGFISRDELPYV